VNIQNVKIVSISIHDIELAKSKENIQLKTEIRKATGTKESDRTLKKKRFELHDDGNFLSHYGTVIQSLLKGSLSRQRCFCSHCNCQIIAKETAYATVKTDYSAE